MGKFSSLMCGVGGGGGGQGYTKFDEGNGELRYNCSECGHSGAMQNASNNCKKVGSMKAVSHKYKKFLGS